MAWHRGVVAWLVLICAGLMGCTQPVDAPPDPGAAWPGLAAEQHPGMHTVTVVIAHSSVLPGGIVGHTGVAVDDRYWDFGPKRVDRFQRLKAFNSPAGPWWDDPDQQWAIDRSLDEVLVSIPDKLHPVGSLVTVFRAEITPQQARAIAGFWDETYTRMRNGEDRYTLRKRQCASMVGWSLLEALEDGADAGDTLPRDLWMVTPTRLYEALRDRLRHTAGPRAGQPADMEQWQLGVDRLEPWSRPAVWALLGVPELPRTRLAIERFKHLPAALAQGSE